MSFWGGRREERVVAGQYLGATTPDTRWEPMRDGRVMDSTIELYTPTGQLVAKVKDAVVAVMAANGKAPEVVVWGERVFILAEPDAYRGRGHLAYREGLAWPLRTGETLEIPLHSVDGTPAGKTVLPMSTGDPDPRPESVESGNPPIGKTTESYITPEFETAAAFLAWAGTNARRWAADFMRRFSRLIMPGALDDGTMIGWFANAIEAGRSAGYAEGVSANIPQTPAAVNEILEGAPESWGEDAAADHIAVQYVREMERRLDNYGITREKYVEERQPDRTELIARLVYETCRRLAPDFGYRAVQAKIQPWDQAPDQARALAVATVERVLEHLEAPPTQPTSEHAALHQAIDSMIGQQGGVLMKLVMGETDPIVTCGCGNRFHGDSINDAVTNWTAHITKGGCPLKEWL